MHGYPHFFPLWISIALAKIYSFHMVLIWQKKIVFSRDGPKFTLHSAVVFRQFFCQHKNIIEELLSIT